MTTMNGNSICLEMSQIPFIYKKGKALLFIGHDIIPVQSTGDSSHLKQKRSLNRKIIKKFAEDSPMGIILLNGRALAFINKTFLSLLGLYSKEDLLKMSPFDLIHPDDRNSVKKLLKWIFGNVVNEPASYQQTMRIKGQYGFVKVLDLRFVVFRMGGKTNLQVMAIDITDEIEKEEMIGQLASDSLYASRNNVVIAGIKKELEDILQNKCRNYPIESHFHHIQKVLEEYSENENDWGLFNKHFEDLHPGFISNLKIICPSLTINEIKHCACIRLNIDTKETARFFNVTPSSIQKARVRLKKKLTLSSDIDLREFIENV
jgi:PAS domain S-box-containing protein